MTRGYSAIGLYQPKTPANIGGVLRAADCYGAALVAVQGQRYKRIGTDTLASYRHIPLLNVPDLHECVPYDCIPIAIERADGAKPIQDFTHPERAFYVFGPEDGSVPKAVQEWCKCVVYIPTWHCMNLAATVNVVLFDRAMKRGEWSKGGDA